MGTTVAMSMGVTKSMNGSVTKAVPRFAGDLYTIPQLAKKYNVHEFHVRTIYDRLLGEGKVARPQRLQHWRVLTERDVLILEEELRQEGWL
jgi:hypothetical protein